MSEETTLHNHLNLIYKHGWEQKGDQWEMVNKAEQMIRSITRAAVLEAVRRIRGNCIKEDVPSDVWDQLNLIEEENV